MPLPGRVALGVIGSAFFVVGLVIFVKPSLAVEHWPWDVTPLTARVVASFTALNVGWAAAALDKRWTALRIPCISQLTGVTLLLLGIVRAWDDVHTDRTRPGSTSARSSRVRAPRVADRDDVSSPERVVGAARVLGSRRGLALVLGALIAMFTPVSVRAPRARDGVRRRRAHQRGRVRARQRGVRHRGRRQGRRAGPLRRCACSSSATR